MRLYRALRGCSCGSRGFRLSFCLKSRSLSLSFFLSFFLKSRSLSLSFLRIFLSFFLSFFLSLSLSPSLSLCCLLRHHCDTTVMVLRHAVFTVPRRTPSRFLLLSVTFCLFFSFLSLSFLKSLSLCCLSHHHCDTTVCDGALRHAFFISLWSPLITERGPHLSSYVSLLSAVDARSLSL